MYIPMIGEIEEEDIADDYYYKCFPTLFHKERNSPWFFTGKDLKEIKSQSRKLINAMMWGK